jgi:hypothetical protein
MTESNYEFKDSFVINSTQFKDVLEELKKVIPSDKTILLGFKLCEPFSECNNHYDSLIREGRVEKIDSFSFYFYLFTESLKLKCRAGLGLEDSLRSIYVYIYPPDDLFDSCKEFPTTDTPWQRLGEGADILASYRNKYRDQLNLKLQDIASQTKDLITTKYGHPQHQIGIHKDNFVWLTDGKLINCNFDIFDNSLYTIDDLLDYYAFPKGEYSSFHGRISIGFIEYTTYKNELDHQALMEHEKEYDDSLEVDREYKDQKEKEDEAKKRAAKSGI